MEGLECVVQLIILIIVLLFNYFVGGMLIEYSLEYWLSYVKKDTVQLPYYPTRVGGIFLAEPAILVSLVTWIISSTIDNPYYESKDPVIIKEDLK